MPISLPLLYACNWRRSAGIFWSDSRNLLTLTKYVFFLLPRKFAFFCKKRKSYVKVLSKDTYRLRKSFRILVDPSLVNYNTNRASTEAVHFPVERISVFYRTVSNIPRQSIRQSTRYKRIRINNHIVSTPRCLHKQATSIIDYHKVVWTNVTDVL